RPPLGGPARGPPRLRHGWGGRQDGGRRRDRRRKDDGTGERPRTEPRGVPRQQRRVFVLPPAPRFGRNRSHGHKRGRLGPVPRSSTRPRSPGVAQPTFRKGSRFTARQWCVKLLAYLV